MSTNCYVPHESLSLHRTTWSTVMQWCKGKIPQVQLSMGTNIHNAITRLSPQLIPLFRFSKTIFFQWVYFVRERYCTSFARIQPWPLLNSIHMPKQTTNLNYVNWAKEKLFWNTRCNWCWHNVALSIMGSDSCSFCVNAINSLLFSL